MEKKSTEYAGLLQVEDVSGHQWKLYTWHGTPVANVPISPDCVEDFVEHFRPRHDDIWICAYPKSGTQWTFSVLHMLVSGKIHVTPNKVLGFVEFSTKDNLEAMASPRILSTHIPLRIFERPFSQHPDMWPDNTKIIHVVRDPLDVATSFYFHNKGHIYEYPFLGDIHDFLDLYLRGEMECGSYFTFLEQWWPYILQHRWDPQANPTGNVLLLEYKKLKQDFISELKKMTAFLGFNHLDEAFLHEVQAATRLDVMRQAHAHEWQNPLVYTEEFTRSGGMFRKGLVGEGKVHFTPEEVERCRRLCTERLGHLEGLLEIILS